MSQIDKLIERLRRRPKDVSPDDLDKLLRFYDFSVHHNDGSHYTYYHPKLKDIITIPSKRPVKVVYVDKVIKAIELLGALDENEDTE